jgi:hypothetical protein
MFDRFTEGARRVMTLARQEAQRRRNDYIGTEHLLLGLVQEGSGVAARVLKDLGVDLRRARAGVDQLVERGASPDSGPHLPFTPRAKRALERALEESQVRGSGTIGTEHLLLGLIRENDGPAAHVLRDLGAEPGAIHAGIEEMLGPPPAGAGGRKPVLHSSDPDRDDPAIPRSPLEAEADLFDVGVRRALELRFPAGGVKGGADYRRTSLGKGFHVVVHWRPDPAKPPLASISVVAGHLESLREKLPEILDLLADLAAKEFRRDREPPTA